MHLQAFPVAGFQPEIWFVANDFADAPYLNLVIARSGHFAADPGLSGGDDPA